MAVRLISAFWAQKTFDSHFLDMVYVEFMKNIHLADSNEVMVVRLISAYSAKKRLFLLFRHDVRRVHQEYFSCRFEPANGC